MYIYYLNSSTSIVWRTVLEDAKRPFAQSSVVANHSGWIEVAPTRDNSVSFKAYCKVQLNEAATVATRLGRILHAMRGGSRHDKQDIEHAFTTMQDAFLCGFRVFETDIKRHMEDQRHGVVSRGKATPSPPWSWGDMAVEAPSLSAPSYAIRCEA
ncbi:hypothetical protein H257_07311 [Aphanomyces astaci]|uniref:Uncharacterized protein n=1 Tax=Aphanomyces astaci TaxID=112090 RepID=W4GIV3_APHAT|nr:hypothetical protein H257_07311 [Aphanomyces astaci]ETV79246.1 hypothetical protein H257_07311 [Aphanomyces astaci]|eukprot:XP_009831087.1 hypothetical protein H257_07311 [Aphanomyces astaci]